MDRFDAMRVFARIVERRSFTQAADDLGLPRSSVTDAVKGLEARLGVPLLQRTTRQVSPTLDGEAYYQRCVSLIADMEDAEGAFVGAKPSGLVRVDVHGTQARYFLLPGLPRFRQQYPDIRLHFSEAHQPPDDLLGHEMVGMLSPDSGDLVPLTFGAGGNARQVKLPAMVTVTGPETNVACACMGLGLIQVPRYRVSSELASGALVEVLAGFPPSPLPIHVLYSHTRQLSPRLRVFIYWMAALPPTPDVPITTRMPPTRRSP